MIWHLDEMNSRRLTGEKKTQFRERERDRIHNINISKYKKEKSYSTYSIFYTFFYVRAVGFHRGKHKLETLRIFLIEY